MIEWTFQYGENVLHNPPGQRRTLPEPANNGQVKHRKGKPDNGGCMSNFEKVSEKIELCHNAQIGCVMAGKLEMARIWAIKKLALVEKLGRMTIEEAGNGR